MEILKKEKILCPCCMEEHEVITTIAKVKTIFKDKEIEYDSLSYYCENEESYYESEEMITQNDITMKNVYRKLVGLLTSEEISKLRLKYGISQSDLSILLGWGEKTITRYEGHQVQDAAHDTILRKINDDPEWFIDLLRKSENCFSKESYAKYLEKAATLYEDAQDLYLRKAIFSQYIRYEKNSIENGNTLLNLDKIIDVINYFANSDRVTNLFKVKLMKLLWYADSLSFKRYNRSITGLVYQALPMGAVPIAYESIVDLKGINYEEISFDEMTGYKFISSSNKTYSNLTMEDRKILDDVIINLGTLSKREIVNRMHSERAYIETASRDIIQFKYALDLSLS